MQRTSSRYTFGRFQLDAGERRLMRDGQPVPLTPKAFDTLLALVLHAGHAVSKDELMHAVWPDGFVEESNLAFNISTLRKALGKGQNGERYIETVPKLGYRFAMPVEAVLDGPKPLHTSNQRKRTNLQAQLSRFIGRQQEIAEVISLVQSRRLVTLTGSGGVGKTRLAMEAGKQALHHFADGVWIAEFAPLADEALVPATVAGVFQLQEQPNRSSLEMLVAFIGEKHLLLIFDNCEHVIDASASLADGLLRKCPSLHILATSREGLRIAGESIWRVPSLDVPAASSAMTVDQASEYDAVQLFVENAALVQPNFSLTQNNLEAVASICRRLDGIPLAIEMAAAQLDVLDLKQIAAGFETSFDGLIHGSRTAVPRHQTLRATLDWSYNLLSETERRLLARLSVFRGGFTAEAAQMVCQASQHTLLQLVRKSMVDSYVENINNQMRYRLLEVVRQFADEKLLKSGEYEATLNHHLDLFLKMAEEPIDLEGPRVNAWLQRMRPEYENVRAAFTRAMTFDDHGEKVLRLSYAMTRFWYHCGPLHDYEGWVYQALNREDVALAAPSVRARGMAAKFGCCLFQGRMREAFAIGEAALDLFHQTDDKLGTAWCLEHLANNLFDERVQTLAEEALILFRKLDSRDGEGRALRALGTAAYRSGDHVRALTYLEQSIATAPWNGGECLWHVYEIDPKRALHLSENEPFHLAPSQINILQERAEQFYGTILVAEGRFVHARQKWESLLHYVSSSQSPIRGSRGCWEMLILGYIEHALQHDARALAWLDKAEIVAGETCFENIRLGAQFLKTVYTRKETLLEATYKNALKYLQGFQKQTFRPFVVCSFILLADIAWRQKNAKLACQWLGVASSHVNEVAKLSFWMGGVPWAWHRDAQTEIVAPALAAARAALGDAVFEAAYAAGQSMSLDEAVAIALNG